MPSTSRLASLAQSVRIPPRVQRTYPDAQVSNFLRQDIAEATDGPFCCLIGRQSWRRGPATRRGHLEDMAGVLFTHHWQHRTSQIYHTEQIGFQLIAEI